MEAISKKLLRSIKLQNILSYGIESHEIELRQLNVLIGPNASGKSNLLEVIGFLRAMPKDLNALIRESGGVDEWLWKGGSDKPVAKIETIVEYPEGVKPLRCGISFSAKGQRFEVTDEFVEEESRRRSNEDDVIFYYRYLHGNPTLNVRTEGSNTSRKKRSLRREDLSPEQSVLSQRKDPDQYPELTYLSSQFSKIRLYREWNLGRYTPPRLPQKTDAPEDFLEEDASNLGLILNDLQHRSGVRQSLVEYLKKFYGAIEDITTKIHGGTVQLFLHEKGLSQPIPATRLSDGTLRYLCLLAILCHPSPPPLLCIEKPELGLHPDIIPVVAELLIESSRKTQVIVTTHSDALVSALSEESESVLVCDRNDQGSTLTRLDANHLKEWLEKYSLGELWKMGELGGTRW